MNEITIFENPEFGEVRTLLDEKGEVLFCASDVAKALGYTAYQKAVRTHCRGVTILDTPTSSGIQPIHYIYEPDVYRLITKSKLPTAVKFEVWVFEEVLPSIRKHGAYMTPEKLAEVLLTPDNMIQLCQNLKAEQEKVTNLTLELEEAKPKIIFSDAVSESKTTIPIGDLAKLLKQNGVNIGEKRLFQRLRDLKYLMSRKSSWNLPTQRSMDMRLFEISEYIVTHVDGEKSIPKAVRVTGKGQIYFINLFLREERLGFKDMFYDEQEGVTYI